jgi:hypothetical protein
MNVYFYNLIVIIFLYVRFAATDKKYVQQFRHTYLKDDHYWEKLYQMSKLDEAQIRAFDPILVAPEERYYRILDGVHRAAIALYRGLNQAKCTVFEN